MGTRLYVGNLPFSADESAVRSLFEQNERQVEEVKLITDRDTGRPRGFGFVEMGSSEHAGQAIQELNGHSMDGRIGSGGGAVTSRLPFQIEPQLPLEVTAGDRVDLPIAVIGEEEQREASALESSRLCLISARRDGAGGCSSCSI